MSSRTYIKELKDHLKSEVVIKGFVHAIRNQGGIKFVVIRDITGSVQVVVLKSEKEVFEAINTLSVESVVAVRGLVKEEKQAPGGIEIEAKELVIYSRAAELPIPVAVEKGSDDVDITKRLDYRWLDLRKQESVDIFKVWTELERGFRDYYAQNGFLQIYTPSFMSTASESGAEVFAVEYFDKKAYLAQSPQFYKQMAMAAGLEKVFVNGPVYRAEPSYTTRHLTEFTGWDFEVSYINSHEDIMAIEEALLVSGFTQMKSAGLNVTVPTTPFPKVTMAEAKKMLALANVPSEKEHDLSPEEERELCKMMKEERGSDFVFVTNYHISVRPFYHMRHDTDPELTKSFDLLYKGVEVTTGAQREHRYDVLVKQAQDKGMDVESLEDYLNFFKYGCPPHGGVGMGPGRFVMKILDLSSVKEATYLPRDVKRLRP